jgi:hypothetical protein
MRPLLKSSFPLKYEGKDGAQNLQRDLRYIKIATNGRIPEDRSSSYLSNLIMKGKSTVVSKVPNLECTATPSTDHTQPTLVQQPPQHSSPATTSSDIAHPPMQSVAVQQPLHVFQQNSPATTSSDHAYPLMQSSPVQQPLHVFQQNSPLQMAQYPYLSATPYQYFMYPNYMYPPTPASPSLLVDPPLPMDSPPKNPPLPKDSDL